MGPQQGDADPFQEADSAEFFRLLNNTRKSRADKFLNHPLTRYNLLSALTVSAILSPVTRLLFKLHEGKDIEDKIRNEDHRDNKRRRMRQWFKGPEKAFVEGLDLPQYDFIDILRSCKRAINDLWDGSKFHTAIQFWPPTEAKPKMFESLCEQRLLNISQLKWRMIAKFELPPFSASWLDQHESLDTVFADDMEKTVEDFCSLPQCCLDPFWSSPAQKKVLAAHDRAGCFFRLIKEFFQSFRPTSLSEEKKTCNPKDHSRRPHRHGYEFCHPGIQSRPERSFRSL